MKTLKRLIINDQGQGLVEYSLIISLVVLGALGALGLFGGSVWALYETIKNGVITIIS